MDKELFGVPSDFENSDVILVPVPWDVTASYGKGASQGPQAILQASPQIDLFDVELGTAYEVGYHMLPIDPQMLQKNMALSELSNELLPTINQGTQEMVNWVEEQTLKILDAGKVPGVVGGDHSSPLGAIQAIGKKLKGEFGILHIDAHADLRKAYQGFNHSHASIMRNVMEGESAPKILVQAGIRDFCEEEWQFICDNEERIHTYFDHQLKSALFAGTTWHDLCDDMIESLPENVYVSFDIDGLSPEFCPGTGTPVPGGFSFDHMVHLLSLLGQSGRKIVGFDLCEVAPQEGSEWDGNVGARLLFKLCGWAAVTNGRYEIG